MAVESVLPQKQWEDDDDAKLSIGVFVSYKIKFLPLSVLLVHSLPPRVSVWLAIKILSNVNWLTGLFESRDGETG